MTILGIDLGTTNSACAIWKDGKPLLIPNRLGEYLTPSVVGLDNDGELLVGEVARQRLLTHPDKTASVFKRYMGTDHLLRLGKKNYSAIELSSLVLKHLKEDAEAYLKTSLLEAIISVPAYFNDLQRKATKAAAELAGLKVERLINEPTAAAMVYGLHEQSDGAQFIILDLGGGTFDVSLVEYFEGVLEVHASSGDNHLGGEDFLKVLEIDFLEKNQLKPEKLTAKNRNSLLFALESAKQALSTQHEVTLEHVIPDQKEPWLMTRKSFESLSLPLLSRIQMPIQQALRDAQVSPQEISEVILVGGSTRLTSVRTLISRLFKRLPLSTLDPDLVIAMGAGIQAGLKEKQSDLADLVLTDVSPYSLGLEVANKNDESDKQGGLFSPIIERNSTVPISIEKPFHTIQDNQTELELNIFQGESRLVRNNIFLGSLNVNIPKAKAGVEAIDVRFSYDMNGLLEVDTTVRSTGQTFNKTIVNTQESLSETALAASRIKLAKLKFHPRDHEQNRLLLARADKIFESSLSERREYISSLTNEFDAVLQRQQPTEITRAAKEFTKILDELEHEGSF